MNNVKKKHDNNNWVRDVLTDTDPHQIQMRKRAESRRINLKKKEQEARNNKFRVALNLPLVKEVKPKIWGYVKRFF